MMLYSAVGRRLVVDGSVRIVSLEGETGYVVYGPYDVLRSGTYTVTFDIKAERPIDGDQEIGTLDVVSDLKVIAERKLYARDIEATSGVVTLSFDLETASSCEYRVFTSGQVGLSVLYARSAVHNRAGSEDWSPVLPHGATTENEFFRSNFPKFFDTHNKGWHFDVSDSEVKAIRNFSFFVESIEDFQLMNEIVDAPDYRIVPRRPTLAIDVGMNIGLASLFLAGIDEIVEVHSFEPFTRPYRRSIKNFAANPVLGAKIKPLQVGLSDRDAELTPNVGEGSIGTGIHGLEAGTPDRITIRTAASQLRPLIERSEQSGYDVFVKMDCEGSEFAIFESLSTAGLLGRIDAMVVEWHKWWSADKTQFDLIARLHEAGFIVFDRTADQDKFAGLMYAIRAARR